MAIGCLFGFGNGTTNNTRLRKMKNKRKIKITYGLYNLALATKTVGLKEAAELIIEARIFRRPDESPVVDLFCNASQGYMQRVATIPTPNPNKVDWNDPDKLLEYARANLPNELNLVSV